MRYARQPDPSTIRVKDLARKTKMVLVMCHHRKKERSEYFDSNV